MVLNGTSSAGKTSIAQAFQAQRAAVAECWVVFGIDDFLPKLPRRWVAVDAWSGSLAGDGVQLERDGARATYRIGALGRRLLSAYRRSIGELARCGLNVIVDDVTLEREEWDEWRSALDGIETVWVAVRCDTEVAVEREGTRGNRAQGLVRGQADLVHRYPVYDLELDSTSESPDTLARRLDAYLEETQNRAG